MYLGIFTSIGKKRPIWAVDQSNGDCRKSIRRLWLAIPHTRVRTRSVVLCLRRGVRSDFVSQHKNRVTILRRTIWYDVLCDILENMYVHVCVFFRKQLVTFPPFTSSTTSVPMLMPHHGRQTIRRFLCFRRMNNRAQKEVTEVIHCSKIEAHGLIDTIIDRFFLGEVRLSGRRNVWVFLLISSVFLSCVLALL